jgi:hypothetical protein
LRWKIFNNLPPLPNVVSAGENVGTGGEKLLGDPGRNAKSGRGILTIDYAEVYFALLEDVREPVVNNLAAGRTYDVTNE